MFAVFTDGSANLPMHMLDGINLLPCRYTIDDIDYEYKGDVEKFDGHTFYTNLKEGKKVKTTLLNTHLFIKEFEEYLKKGLDVIYVSMSSKISGTFNAARLAALELMENYPERKVEIIDSLGCGFGSGLIAVKAAELSKKGSEIIEAARTLREDVSQICQYFTVDDIEFLKSTGRVSGVAAGIATALSIKPILYGDETGHIKTCAKVRGRKASIEKLAQIYSKKVKDAFSQIVCISHGDCLEDAKLLASRISEIAKPMKIEICQHEPFSGSHVGPGMLGLFFCGHER